MLWNEGVQSDINKIPLQIPTLNQFLTHYYLLLPCEPINPLKLNDLKKRRTAQLTSRCCILYIYSRNIRIEYFKHAA